MESLPQIPGATLTGMRTMIHGDRSTRVLAVADTLHSGEDVQEGDDVKRAAGGECDAKQSITSYV